MDSRRPLVVGNWKMHGSRASAVTLAHEVHAATANAAAEIVLCPPFIYLERVLAALPDERIAVGAQDVSAEAEGAHTGDCAAAMLVDTGCRHVIVGHSERRRDHGETDALVAAKMTAALAAGLSVIVCVGESLEEREAGQTEAVVARQLAPLTTMLAACAERVVLAYEPIWAIGTGRTASAEMAQEVHAHLRGLIAAGDPAAAARSRILYGGSVNAGVAAALFAMPDIDGALVGGASLKPVEFASICNAA
jgi:triosephosphate isomerase (TIM)